MQGAQVSKIEAAYWMIPSRRPNVAIDSGKRHKILGLKFGCVVRFLNNATNV